MIRFARLLKDDRGASIVELAIIAPVLASLLIGMVDLSRAYSRKLQLEQAAQRAIQKVQAYQNLSSDFSALKSEVAAVAEVPESNVAVDYWLECNGNRQASYDRVCPEGEAYVRLLTVDVRGEFVPLFKSRIYPHSNADGTITLHGTAGMRTQ